MQRFLNRKALELALVGLALMAVMVALGLWQLSVYDDHQDSDAQAALSRPAVPLDSLLGPDAALTADGAGRPVTVSGRYLANDQVYVRKLAGSSRRYAVVTPLVTANGSAVLVVRGSRDMPSARAPVGPVTVTGILEPSGENAPEPDASGVTDGLSVSSLVNAVGPDLYSGYVLLQASNPQQSPRLAPVTPPLSDPARWSGIRNLLYACQWWVFALFVAFMWWRMTQDLVAEDDRESSGLASEPIDGARSG
ncbi:MAG: SURF1 family protein [Nocardioidaceae bacterium]